MLLKLYQAGQPELRKPTKVLNRKTLASKRTQDIIDFMIATLKDASGVGLAAPQIGESLQIIIIEDKVQYHEQVPAEVLKAQGRRPISLKVLVNPKLTVLNSEQRLFFEGCLSVDGYAAAVPRAISVKVTAWDRKGKVITYISHDWHARILQHEIDHLNGTLYIDHMKTQSFMTIKNFTRQWRQALPEQIEKAFNKD